jgi:hypothetical protein
VLERAEHMRRPSDSELAPAIPLVSGDRSESRADLSAGRGGHDGYRANPALVLLQDRFWGNVVSCFACDRPPYLSGS